MAACTICTLDPCPHLRVSGGTAGAPITIVGAPIKYAPSLKPHCPSCDRVHRNIGNDNQPVCAWRTYSKAKGEDFAQMTPDAVDEFARWYRAGAWAPPSRKSKGSSKSAPAPSTPTPGVHTPAPSPAGRTDPAGVGTAPTPTATVPLIADLEDDPKPEANGTELNPPPPVTPSAASESPSATTSTPSSPTSTLSPSAATTAPTPPSSPVENPAAKPSATTRRKLPPSFATNAEIGSADKIGPEAKPTPVDKKATAIL